MRGHATWAGFYEGMTLEGAGFSVAITLRVMMGGMSPAEKGWF
jgi:hypothetical protein